MVTGHTGFLAGSTNGRLGRYPMPTAAPGWMLSRACRATPMASANGMRIGPDGLLYVAQFAASTIRTVDLATGEVATAVGVEDGFPEPDDIAFDSAGNLYVTELMEGRVSARDARGRRRVLATGLPSANGITVHQDRIFMDEYRPDGGVWEVYPDGRAPRNLASGVSWANAMAVGPDGMLYYPTLASGEVWRVPIEGGTPARVIGDIAIPIAVKFDRAGNLVVLAAATGEIVRVDVPTARSQVIGRGRPGLDNLVFDQDGRLFVSQGLDGGVSEILPDGSAKAVIHAGLMGPWDIAFGADGGLYVADGASLVRIGPDGRPAVLGSFFTDADYPGFLRCIATAEDGALYVADGGGTLSRYVPRQEKRILADGLGQVMSIAALPGGEVALTDHDGGRLLSVAGGKVTELATQLGRPTGLARAADGSFYVADAAQGRVLHVGRSGATVLVDGLSEPHGVALHGDLLYVVDRKAGALHEVALAGGASRIVAAGLPIGVPSGVPERIMPGMVGTFPGPVLPVTGLTVDPGGRLYISGDGEGSVIVAEFVRP